MKQPREQDIVKAILEYLHVAGIFAWRQNSGATRATHKGRTRFIRYTSINGIPDIVGMLPDGRFLGIEVKRPRQRLRSTQETFRDLARDATGDTAVIFTACSIDDVICELSGHCSNLPYISGPVPD